MGECKKGVFDEKGILKEIGEEYKKYIEYFFTQKRMEMACKIIQNELQQQRIYITQLEIIGCDYTEKIEAKNDFI